MDEEAIEAYKSSLSDLTFNSKPLINMLTMLAEENEEFAVGIVDAIENHLSEAKPTLKLPAMYLVDSIVKNLKGNTYKKLFTHKIVNIFCSVFEKVDEKIRTSLFKLRQTWSEDIFPPNKMYALDIRVKQVDPAWPILAPQPEAIHGAASKANTIQKPQSTATSLSTHPMSSIHINPKFIKKFSGNSGSSNVDDDNVSSGKGMSSTKLGDHRKRHREDSDPQNLEEKYPPIKTLKSDVSKLKSKLSNVAAIKTDQKQRKSSPLPPPATVKPPSDPRRQQPSDPRRSPPKRHSQPARSHRSRSPQRDRNGRRSDNRRNRSPVHSGRSYERTKRTRSRSPVCNRRSEEKNRKPRSPAQRQDIDSSRLSEVATSGDSVAISTTTSTDRDNNTVHTQKPFRIPKLRTSEPRPATSLPSPSTQHSGWSRHKLGQNSDTSREQFKREPADSYHSPAVPDRARSRRQSLSIEQQNIQVPAELQSGKAEEILKQAEQQLKSGRLSVDNHQKLIKQLSQLYKLQKIKEQIMNEKSILQDTVEAQERDNISVEESVADASQAVAVGDVPRLVSEPVSKPVSRPTGPPPALRPPMPPPIRPPGLVDKPPVKMPPCRPDGPPPVAPPQPPPRAKVKPTGPPPVLRPNLPLTPRPKHPPPSAAPPLSTVQPAHPVVPSTEATHTEHVPLQSGPTDLVVKSDIPSSSASSAITTSALHPHNNLTTVPSPVSGSAKDPELAYIDNLPPHLRPSPAEIEALKTKSKVVSPSSRSSPQPDSDDKTIVSDMPYDLPYDAVRWYIPTHDPRWLRKVKPEGASLSDIDCEYLVINGKLYTINVNGHSTITVNRQPWHVYKSTAQRKLDIRISAQGSSVATYFIGSPVLRTTIGGLSYEIYYRGGLRRVWVDGFKFTVYADAPPLTVLIAGSEHDLQVDGTTNEVLFDEKPVAEYRVGKTETLFIDGQSHVMRFTPNPKPILFDAKHAEVAFRGEFPCIVLNKVAYGIRFDGTAKEVIIDGTKWLVKLDKPRTIKLPYDSSTHIVAIGGPGHELIIDGVWHEVKFNAPPVEVQIGSVLLSVEIRGELPAVKLLGEFVDDSRYIKDLTGATIINLYDALDKPDAPVERPMLPRPPRMPVPQMPPDSSVGGSRFRPLRPGMRPRPPPPYLPRNHPRGPPMPRHPPMRPPRGLYRMAHPPQDAVAESSTEVESVQNQLDVDNLLAALVSSGIINTTSPASTPGSDNQPGGAPTPGPASNNSSVTPTGAVAGTLPPAASASQLSQSVATVNEKPTAQPTETPEPEEMPEFVTYDGDKWKKRSNKGVDELYHGTLCSQCGLRFTAANLEKYSGHLDWHFRQNQKDKDDMKSAPCRGWMTFLHDWCRYEKTEGEEQSGPACIVSGVSGTYATEQQDDSSTTVTIEHEGDETCKICREKFEQQWDDDAEVWMLTDAIRINEKTYHAYCHEDTNNTSVLDAAQSEPPTPLSASSTDPLSFLLTMHSSNVDTKSPTSITDVKVKVEQQQGDSSEQVHSSDNVPSVGDSEQKVKQEIKQELQQELKQELKQEKEDGAGEITEEQGDSSAVETSVKVEVKLEPGTTATDTTTTAASGCGSSVDTTSVANTTSTATTSSTATDTTTTATETNTTTEGQDTTTTEGQDTTTTEGQDTTTTEGQDTTTNTTASTVKQEKKD